MVYENELTLRCKKLHAEKDPDKRRELTEEIIRLLPATDEQAKRLRESNV